MLNKTGDKDPAKETMVAEQLKLPVHNARQRSEPATLDKNGFQLVSHDTSVNFDSDEQIRATYYKEMEDLLKQHTGAERCILFDHIVRKVAGPKDGHGFKDPDKSSVAGNAVTRVHGDYTASPNGPSEGGAKRVLELCKTTDSGSYLTPPLTEEEANHIVAHKRFAIVNAWRNISRSAPVLRMPLGIVDCATTVPDDLFIVDLIFPDRKGTTYALDPRPQHRWYYYPAMKFTEVLLFRTFDNSEDANLTGRFAIHAAFDDPTTQPLDPNRESIEVRVLVIFPDQSGEPLTKKSRL